MAGLEELGIPGGEFLRESLTNCADPLAAIEEFQTDNGILLPSLRPALPFVDLHDIKRLDFHSSVLEELRERLVQQISDVASGDNEERYKKLESLLEKSFPVIKVKSLRPVVMAILKHLPQIKDEYLEKILDDKELYAEAATEVKRQIWSDNQALFGDEVSPLLSQYIKEKENSLFSHENSAQTFYLASPKLRRQSEVVQRLADMVGKNVKLYDMVLQFLRTLFLRTRNMHYCTLRAELLMALHDQEVNDICSIDPCHKFTWCVDACIRDKFIDSKRSRELQGFLDGIRRGQEFVLGDLSMVLCDPFSMNTVGLSMMRNLQHCLNNESLPRDSSEIVLLVRMMGLGLGSWDMIDSQLFREPKLESSLFTKFLPMISSLMVEDHTRVLSAKLPEEPPLSATPPSDLFLTFVKENPIASFTTLYYSLQVTRMKDRVAACNIIPVLVHCENERAYEDTFLHSLISFLIAMSDEFAHDDFCSVVFDDYLLPGISRENVFRHLLRLLWYIHPKVPPGRLQAILDGTQPNNEHSECVHTIYQQLTDKINAWQPSPATPQEQLDSPLMSVPTPAPL